MYKLCFRKTRGILVAASLLTLACGVESTQTRPKLAVMIIVDQMRADHLTRFAGVYQGGFARLLKEGAVFTNGHHDHSHTVTGAGHATIATGCFPSRHGVVGNNWFDRIEDREVYCARDDTCPLLGYPDEDRDDGRSPNRLLKSTIGDWLKEKFPQSKVFGVARKDRAAIMSAGKKADSAYWYNDDDGNMITSVYYRDTYPDWVDQFNRSRIVDQYFEPGWTKLMPEEVYFLAREDDFPTEANGRNTTFPHPFQAANGQIDQDYYDDLEDTPFVDHLTIEFAKALIDNEGLGADDSPDLLAIGCSAADAVGHEFGPLSQESLDHFLRLDEYLGDLFDYLDQKIGTANYVTVLSSDHGVLPLPEELKRRGYAARRIAGSELLRHLAGVASKVMTELSISGPLVKEISGHGLLLNYDAATKQGVTSETLDITLEKHLLQLDFIEDVFTKDDLASGAKNGRKFQEIFSHSYHPERSGDLVVRFKEYLLVRGAHGTTHGSPYSYDTHVPIVFAGPGVKASRHGDRVRTVDIAPTLADLLDLTVPEGIDGRILNEVRKP